MPNVYRVIVEEVLDRGAFQLKQGTSNQTADPTSPANRRATYICEPTTDAKFDTLLSTIDTAIDTAES